MNCAMSAEASERRSSVGMIALSSESDSSPRKGRIGMPLCRFRPKLISLLSSMRRLACLTSGCAMMRKSLMNLKPKSRQCSLDKTFLM